MSNIMNECMDVGDIVIMANEAYDEYLMEDDCCCDDEYCDREIDDDVYDAAEEDLYEDGIGIGDLDAEEMSCTATDIVENEIEDELYDSMVDGEDDVRMESSDLDDEKEDDDYESEEEYALPASDDPDEGDDE